MAVRSRIKNRRGFSLIEIIAAVVILAVVATATVATITPLREKSRAKIDQQNIAKLNGTVQAYYMEYGAYPDRNLTILRTRGYTSTTTQPTPYGGNYQWDTARLTVVNPNAPATP
jgi:general secretion pathway protein G